MYTLHYLYNVIVSVVYVCFDEIGENREKNCVKRELRREKMNTLSRIAIHSLNVRKTTTKEKENRAPEQRKSFFLYVKSLRD